MEMNVDIMLKATKVDAFIPVTKIDSDAIRFHKLSLMKLCQEFASDGCNALTLCRDQNYH